MRKQLLHKRNLWEYKTAITDTSNLSPKFFNFTEFPSILTAGKNVIKLKVNKEYMEIGTSIYIEILDSNDDLIYYEVLDYLEEDLSRVISIYIYDDTASGDAKFTIAGTAKKGPNGEVVNNSSVNVKFNKLITVAADKRNKSEIIYDDGSEPSVSVIERIVPYQERTYNISSSVTSSNGTVSYNNGVVTSNGFEFKREMIGGTLIVPTPVNSYPANSTSITNVTYSAIISDIYNANQAKVSKVYAVSSSNYDKHIFKSFDGSSYELRYLETGSLNTTQNKKSYAYAKFHNLEPDTGDVYRIKANYRSSGEMKNQWEQIDDIQVEATELLIDSSSNDMRLSYGDIKDQNVIDTYYTLTDIGGATHTSMSIDSASLLDSIRLDINQELSSSQYFYIKPTNLVNFYMGHEYELTYKAYSYTNVSHSGIPLVDVFVSGSAFKNEDNIDQLGKYIGRSTNSGNTRYDVQSFTFSPDKNGNGNFALKVKSGKWHFSEFSLKSKHEFGFTPNQIVGIFSVPTKYRNDNIDIQFEFYNYQNQQSDKTVTVTNLLFTGSNSYIQGDDNLITGSTFVGTELDSGLEMFGNQGGGYMRTFGYTNFTSESNGSGSGGIIIFSGSSNYGDEYQGIGMEMFTSSSLHGMYFGDQHGMYQRPGLNELYAHEGVLNGVPTYGRGDIVYGYVSSSNGVGTALAVKSDGTWFTAGTYTGDPEYGTQHYPAKGLAITSGTGSMQPILLRGLFQSATFTLIAGNGVYTSEGTAFRGQFTSVLPITDIQKVGSAYGPDLAYFDFPNAINFSGGTITG